MGQRVKQTKDKAFYGIDSIYNNLGNAKRKQDANNAKERVGMSCLASRMGKHHDHKQKKMRGAIPWIEKSPQEGQGGGGITRR